MNMQKIAAAAIRLVMHEREYSRIVARPRTGDQVQSVIGPAWERVVKARRELAEVVRQIQFKDGHR